MSNIILPPNDIVIERALLGSLMIDPTAISTVAAHLKPNHFYLVAHQMIYEAILATGESTDLFTISRYLAQCRQLDEVGGESVIAELSYEVPTALNADAYARIIERKAAARRIINAASDIAKAAWADKEEDELADIAQTELIKAVEGNKSRRVMTMDEAADLVWTDLVNTIDTGIVPGIPTGIDKFDYMVGGWKAGRLTVIGALPGHGKTTLMHNTILHAAKTGHRAAFFTLEMTEPELLEAMASNEASVDISPTALIRANPRDQQIAKDRMADALQKLRKLPLFIRYMPGASPADMVYECKRIRGVEIVAFDYIQMGSANLAARGANREQEVAAVALGLKNAAGELKAHVLTGSQVNEAGETRESRAVTQHADTVIYLKRDEERPSNDVLLSLIADFWKNRKGKTGPVPLVFHKTTAHIGGLENAK